MYSISKSPFWEMTERMVLSMNSAWLNDGVMIEIFINDNYLDISYGLDFFLPKVI